MTNIEHKLSTEVGWKLTLPGVGITRFKQVMYRQTSDIRRTLLANKIVDHSDVAEASPARRDGKHISTGIRCDLY